MGKGKKRKKSFCDIPSKNPELIGKENEGKSRDCNLNDEDTVNSRNNPLYREQELFLSSLTSKERNFYFSSSSISPDRRAEIWMEQAEIGESLVNRHAWATPTIDCLKIFRKFSPIVEIGSGSNADWAKYMKQSSGIDIVAYDMNIQMGGKIRSKETAGEKIGKNTMVNPDDKSGGFSDDLDDASNAILRRGGPEVLKLPELRNHTLFLCYPDEEDQPSPDDDKFRTHSGEQDNGQPLSFGWQCLNEFKGTYVIHVGELAVLGDATLNMEQSPWGRSSSPEFQQRLASEFHCIAKIQLPNWLHVRDSISVWKRSQICEIVFVADDDEEGDEGEEIMEYRHIPPEEMLPGSVVAPCMANLLPSSVSVTANTPTTKMESNSLTPIINRKKSAKKVNVQRAHPKHVSSEEEITNTVLKSEEGANNDDNKTPSYIQNRKIKRQKRRERQKQKKLLSMQHCSSQDDIEEKNKRKKEKIMRSEFFRLHGKLPLEPN